MDNPDTAIDAVAAGISALALASSIASAIAAWSSSQAAKTVARLERERRHDELAPHFHGVITDPEHSPDTPLLTLTLWKPDGLGHLDRLRVEILDDRRYETCPYLFHRETLPRPADDGHVVEADGRPVGGTWDFRLQRAPRRPSTPVGPLRLRLTCHQDGQEKPWVRTADVQVQADGMAEFRIPES